MKKFNILYLKISTTLLVLLAVLGFMYVWISHYVAEDYVQEINQKLYGGIAQSTANEVKPWVNGKVDTTAIQDIMHSMMVMNPSVEVYLLDTVGNIVTYVAPYKRVKLDKVNLSPVKQFIAEGKERSFIKGDDPRHPEQENIFSAAPIVTEGNLEGYFYLILASEEQAEVVCSLQNSYIYKLGQRMFFISMFGAMLIGLLAIWFLTKNLRTIIETVTRFKEGDYQARVADKDKGDLAILATTYNEMADQIVENIEQLKSVENLRRELIANVSHDLRTPLAIMQGYVETMLMKNESLAPTDREQYLKTVLSSSEKLSKLISQLFEYSKLEAKQIEPQKEPFFVAELAQDVFHKYQILAQEKNISLHLNMSKDLPLVFADVALVERVIQNLMDNALKFTPNGGRIQLDLSPNDQHVEIKIADNGPGISEEQQSYIFERYRKADRKGVQAGGAGLGLAIVKKILELHDATIRVQSRLNEGTAFMFQLPAYANATT